MSLSTNTHKLFQAGLLVPAMQQARLQTYIDLASLVVFLYDYCLTFGTEYKLIWPTNISVTKLLFIVVRYVPFADLTIVLWHQWKPRMSINECDLAYRSTAFLFITGIITAEVVLAMRTWAVWAQDKFVGYFLIVWVLLTTIPNFTLLGLLAKGLSFIPLDVPWTGCFISSGNPLLLSLCWVLLMIMEAGTLILMFIKGYQNFRMQGRTPLFNAVYRDGSLFYVYLFAFSVINVSVIFTVPNGLFLLSSLERALHSILVSRLLMGLREAARFTSNGSTAFSASGLELSDLSQPQYKIQTFMRNTTTTSGSSNYYV